MKPTVSQIAGFCYLHSDGCAAGIQKGAFIMQNCQDTFPTTFTSYNELFGYQQQVSSRSQWSHCAVNQLHVEPLNHNSSCYPALKEFAPGVSSEAVEDSFNNLGLAIRFDQKLYPVRETAYKSLLDRAKVSGSGLNKLTKTELAQVLNTFLSHFRSEALVLVRDEKISAVHSGDESDYAILPIDLLLGTLQAKLDVRFPGNVFDAGYSDHAITSASWELPDQKDDLIGTYTKLLDAKGKSAMASRLTPGIRFLTSDTGIASAKVSALLIGSQHPIHIGSCVAVDHRHKSSIADFDAALDQLFAQFGESMSSLQHLLEVELDYPVNAMTRVCKKLSMPKKAAVEAIAMYEMTYGGGAATAHDVFLAMQEIPFIMKTSGAPESKLLALEENMARALTLNWNEYDLAKAVEY